MLNLIFHSETLNIIFYLNTKNFGLQRPLESLVIADVFELQDCIRAGVFFDDRRKANVLKFQ